MSPPATVTPIATATHTAAWTDIGPLFALETDLGVCARVGQAQVALFLLTDGRLLAIDNRDPIAGANVLSRGIIGETAGRVYVASPLYKQRWCLTSGECLDQPGLSIRTWPVRVVDGRVEIGS